MRSVIVVLLLLASTAHAEDGGDAVSPTTARWISIATSTTGLGLTAYMWHHASELEEGHGRAELQLASIGTGLATIGIGPASGLVVAGEYRRSVGGALARPLLIGAGAGAVVVGSFVLAWGCFETNDCTGAKIGGGGLIGLGALAAAGGVAWGVYDIWDTPRILRARAAKRTTTIAPILGTDRVGLALTIVD